MSPTFNSSKREKVKDGRKLPQLKFNIVWFLFSLLAFGISAKFIFALLIIFSLLNLILFPPYHLFTCDVVFVVEHFGQLRLL